MQNVRIGSALLAFFLLAACSSAAPEDATSTPQPPASSTGEPGVLVSTDTAVDPVVRRLEREAIALARTNGCSTAEQCRSAPMGNRPCGGPRYYVPYCPLTTDTAALFAKLKEVVAAENEYNRREGLMSTCEFRTAPELELAAGACRARVVP